MMFAITSRYAESELASWTSSAGREIGYIRRRFLPTSPPATIIAEHVVSEGERLDNITARYLGDPEQFWRVGDANSAMRPAELETIGRRLLIGLPQGGSNG